MTSGRRPPIASAGEKPPNGGFDVSRDTSPIAYSAQDANLRNETGGSYPPVQDPRRNFEKSPQCAGVSTENCRQAGDNFRIGKCGKSARTAEWKARQSEKLKAFWADPENRRRQREKTIARMASLAIRERISRATATALAKPEIKKRHVNALKQRYADDPELRQRVSERTRAGMARWRAETLAAAEIVLRQLPNLDRDNVLAKLDAARGPRR